MHQSNTATRDRHAKTHERTNAMRLRPLYFFLAFGVGLLCCYFITPPPKVVVKFPSPYNAGQVVYKDSAENCFRFNADKVDCPADPGLTRPQPLMEDFRSRTQDSRVLGN